MFPFRIVLIVRLLDFPIANVVYDWLVDFRIARIACVSVKRMRRAVDHDGMGVHCGDCHFTNATTVSLNVYVVTGCLSLTLR